MTVYTSPQSFPAPLRFLAQMVSVVFHPLCTGVWMMLYITYVHPTLFIAVSASGRLLKTATFVNNNLVFPMLVVLLMRGLGFSKSILLHNRKERIVPYMASIIFFFWTWNVFNHQPDAPAVLTNMTQGIFFAACGALVLNTYYKVSMHAIGMGGLVGMMLMIALDGQAYSLLPLGLSILITGIVSSARLMVSDHRPFDLASGFVLGLAAQLVARWL
jgi:hypothetical protein